MNEHYCRRWVSIRTIDEAIKQKKAHFFDAQISHYENSGNEYLVFSSATRDPFIKNCIRSISVGILTTTAMKKKFKFIENKPLVKQIVGVTCETCAVKNCLQRASPATALNLKKRHDLTDSVVQQYIKNYS